MCRTNARTSGEIFKCATRIAVPVLGDRHGRITVLHAVYVG